MKKQFYKAFALALALGVSLTLCACNAKDPENLLETQAPTKTVQEEPTDLPTNPPTEPPAQPLSTYPYGNMQKTYRPAILCSMKIRYYLPIMIQNVLICLPMI